MDEILAAIADAYDVSTQEAAELINWTEEGEA